MVLSTDITPYQAQLDLHALAKALMEELKQCVHFLKQNLASGKFSAKIFANLGKINKLRRPQVRIPIPDNTVRALKILRDLMRILGIKKLLKILSSLSEILLFTNHLGIILRVPNQVSLGQNLEFC